jgi:CBS domain-containing protein
VDFELNLTSETVQQLPPEAPLCVEANTSVRDVFTLLKHERAGAVLVVRNEALVGIFTERDALRLMAGGLNLDTPVEQVMVPDPVTVAASETVGAAIRKMSAGGYRRLPIIDEEGRPVGIVRVSSILHYLVQHFPQVVYTLPPEPHHATQQREGA